MASSAFATGSLLSLPAGSMIDYAGTSAPEGWLMCDGAEYSKTAYPQLAAALLSNGTFPYGETNGSGGAGTTHFRVPDFRGRFARYNDNMGTTRGAAGRDSGRSHGTDQTQTTARNGLGVSLSGGDHQHFQGDYTVGSGGPVIGSRGDSYALGTYRSTNTTTFSTADNPSAHSHSVSWSGDSETRPINLSCNRIIKI